MVESLQTDKYPDTINDIARSIANNKIQGNREWINGIQTLDIYAVVYYDKEYKEKKKELTEKRDKETKGMMKDDKKTEVEHIYWSSLLRELLLLMGRSGFLGIRYMDGVITEDDVEEAMKTDNDKT